MLVAEDEHAVDTLSRGPRRPYTIEICPAAALFIPSTTVVGRTRPFSRYSMWYDSSIVVAPPRPVPQYTPARCDSCSVSASEASDNACLTATRANCVTRSKLDASCVGQCDAESKSTRPATSDAGPG